MTPEKPDQPTSDILKQIAELCYILGQVHGRLDLIRHNSLASQELAKTGFNQADQADLVMNLKKLYSVLYNKH